MLRPPLDATAVGQPEPRDRLTLAWLLFQADGSAEPARLRTRNVAEAIVNSRTAQQAKALARDLRGSPQSRILVSSMQFSRTSERGRPVTFLNRPRGEVSSARFVSR